MAAYKDGTEARTGDYVVGQDLAGEWIMGRVVRLRINILEANMEVARVGSETLIYGTDFPHEGIFVRAEIAIGNTQEFELVQSVAELSVKKREKRTSEEDPMESGLL